MTKGQQKKAQRRRNKEGLLNFHTLKTTRKKLPKHDDVLGKYYCNYILNLLGVSNAVPAVIQELT